MVVNVGETSDGLVVSGISGPVQVYIGVPAPPPPEVAVRVITAPKQKAPVAEETSPVNEGCAVKVYVVAVTVEVVTQPVPS